jgi:hypothetical protein
MWDAMISKPLIGYLLAALMACLSACTSSEPPLEPAPEVSQMTSPRAWHALAVLPSGQVLVAGGSSHFGQNAFNEPTASAALYDHATGSWTATGSMSVERIHPSSVLLPSGKVLVAGGRSLRSPHLPCGLVRSSAELYDPDTGTFTVTGSMGTPRHGPAAVLLATGDVLAFGGWGDPDLSRAVVTASAELYHPETGTWTRTGDMVTAREGGSAATARLASGDVLVVGGTTSISGCDPVALIADAEIYSPATGAWTRTQALDYVVAGASLTLLPSGNVLLVGGYTSACGENLCARIYDPGPGTWRAARPTNWSRDVAAAVRLPSGKVLVLGGTVSRPEGGVYGDLFDPATETWSTAKLLAYNHGNGARAALLPDGEVLITGGILAARPTGPLIGSPGPDFGFGYWHVIDIAERLHAPD